MITAGNEDFNVLRNNMLIHQCYGRIKIISMSKIDQPGS